MYGTGKINFAGSWILTLMLTAGKLGSMTDISWVGVVAPVVVANLIFATTAVIKGLLYKGTSE